MNRYCNLFFLVFSLLFLSNRDAFANSINQANYCHSGIYTSTCVAPPGSSMQEKKTHNGYTLILIRLGIESKCPGISYKASVHSLDIGCCFTDIAISNAGWIKHILSFSDHNTIRPQFLSAFSLHGPPILC
jgi:hypothetical protein